MVNKLRKILRNEKGFTLVELLAVIVILGIIAAIAVPAIGNVIDDSKRKAHLSNAQMMLEAARLYKVQVNTSATQVTYQKLIDEDLIDDVTPPSGGEDSYNETSSVVIFPNTVILKNSGGYNYFSGNPKSADPDNDVELNPNP
ncbi:type II secretion system protein [Pontibacillus marinus]|uniref:Tfp assembly type protein n=1 Tax=Pontibacillus marinus BH030004 = DSM 16465 TaxID=1385511 RepID=A0A0A5GA41_9BACI|nr:prepilin-type N-terminal cleavage/methylation domain-containing protein [Pontibacillus marinus]KGX88048.1 Tfp assembly type protein [Pontibacillus marinus BH030004 = DSM 16465]